MAWHTVSVQFQRHFIFVFSRPGFNVIAYEFLQGFNGFPMISAGFQWKLHWQSYRGTAGREIRVGIHIQGRAKTEQTMLKDAPKQQTSLFKSI